jgi:hypothetical protein
MSAPKNTKPVVPDAFKAEPKAKGDNATWWFALVLVIGAGLIIWLANSLAGGKKGLPDDTLVRETVRNQFEAIFKQDTDAFLKCYSQDYNNGDYTFKDKLDQVKQLIGADFEVKDFYIEFLKTGQGDSKEEVHIDNNRGFATTYAYTYWRQRGQGTVTFKPLEQMSVFLLRKEGDDWKIIEDKSIILKQREDADHLVQAPQFSPFLDPSKIPWPPPPSKKPAAQSPSPEQPAQPPELPPSGPEQPAQPPEQPGE